ncbi:MAG TPA: glycerophosphodiester phosphodiesterase family protein [Nocardioidaceae bacterium]|nr:glycerophosphodiester phosphodiesterase family protein [Nocardioidaceae bacterium]
MQPTAPGRPQVVAHRGSSLTQPEHTLGAYVAALDEGAEGLECDVRLTADGHLVCVHDRRVDRTTNGHGLVSTMELAQLDELDFASWKRPWADLDDEAEIDGQARGVLSMQRLLETVADYDRPVDLAIETKHPTRYGGLVERRLVELLATFGWAGEGSPARVMSFSWKALNRVRKLAPGLELVLLVDSPYSWKLSRNLIAEDWIAGPGMELLRESPRVAARLRAQGRRIHVWTVNDPADLDLCVRLGVEAVITDTPAATLRHLGSTSHTEVFERGYPRE